MSTQVSVPELEVNWQSRRETPGEGSGPVGGLWCALIELRQGHSVHPNLLRFLGQSSNFGLAPLRQRPHPLEFQPSVHQFFAHGPLPGHGLVVLHSQSLLGIEQISNVAVNGLGFYHPRVFPNMGQLGPVVVHEIGYLPGLLGQPLMGFLHLRELVQGHLLFLLGQLGQELQAFLSALDHGLSIDGHPDRSALIGHGSV
ncbi:MAG: hypothetical protein RL617_1266 [Pseudomonadota bacterium]